MIAGSGSTQASFSSVRDAGMARCKVVAAVVAVLVVVLLLTVFAVVLLVYRGLPGLTHSIKPEKLVQVRL